MSDTSGNETATMKINYIAAGGLAFVYMSFAAFVAAGASLWITHARAPDITYFIPELILIATAVFGTLLGVGLLHAAGAASAPTPNWVINPNEWRALEHVIKEGKEDPITQYVRLRSLSGFTGVFTKLGLQGLPLATIGLTLFFSLMFLRDGAYLDLAKLTLGAFIGSFVQKQVGERQGGGEVKLPSGESIRVRQSPATVA